MDKISSDDVPRLDGELVQLPADDSPHSVQALERLFDMWFSLRETESAVKSMLNDANQGDPMGASSSSGPPQVVDGGSPLETVNDPPNDPIPQFYFENGPPLHDEIREMQLSKIDNLFGDHTNGLEEHEFQPVTKMICELPSFFSVALFQNIDVDSTGRVRRDAFVNYWIHRRMSAIDRTSHIYTILKKPNAKYLTQNDFLPVIRKSLANLPDLEFLDIFPEIRERYARTVIHCIFYYVNRSGNGRLTLGEMKRSDLIPVMLNADEGDITRLKYFCYRDFYVIYCKFCDLDEDDDLLIDKKSLAKYADGALSFTIIDRIFEQAPRKFTSGVEGKMGYEDFVYFIFAEENKSAEPSLEYWFKCIDIDENGVITREDMQWFHEEQIITLEAMDKEHDYMSKDMLCEIIDMIKPENEQYITLRDIKRSKLSPKAFNMLFNATKYLACMHRDRAQIGGQDRMSSEWDRFVSREYAEILLELNLSGSSGSDEDDDE